MMPDMFINEIECLRQGQITDKWMAEDGRLQAFPGEGCGKFPERFPHLPPIAHQYLEGLAARRLGELLRGLETQRR